MLYKEIVFFITFGSKGFGDTKHAFSNYLPIDAMLQQTMICRYKFEIIGYPYTIELILIFFDI